MNSKNAITFGTRRKKMAFLASKLLFLTCLLLVMSSCHRRKSRGEQAQSTDSPVNAVLNYSCAFSPAEGFGILSATNQVTVSEEKDRLLIHATGADPQLGFTVTAPGRYAIYLDVGSPAATLLELFYQVQTQPFSAEHVLRTPLKAGRNQILLSIDDPQFSGGIRLDPGQIAGDYSLYSLQVFSNAPVSFVHPARTQADLSATFNGSTKNLFSARTRDEWGKIQPLHDAQLTADAKGATVKATGPDPQLQLPEFELAGNPIVKVVIVSPAATTLEMFYKTGNQFDYDQAHSSSQPLQPGENTVYLEIPVRAASGALRLDPGMVGGDYLLKEIEVRANTASDKK